MKRIAHLLFALLLAAIAPIAALANTDITLEQMAAANDITTVADTTSGVGVNVIFYDENGDELESLYAFACRDEHGELLHVLEYDDGSVEITTRGEEYGFDGAENRVFITLFGEGRYEEKALNNNEIFFLNLDGDETITSVSQKNGALTVVTQEPIVGKYKGYTDGILEVEHVLDPKTLLLRESYEYYVPTQGERSLLCKTWVTMDVTWQMPEEIPAGLSSEPRRTVKVVADPGTENEFTYVMDVGKEVMVAYDFGGRSFYADAECTQKLERAPRNEDGSFPDESVIYAK